MEKNNQKIDVKSLEVKTITASLANEFVRRWHYSGKVVPNSQVHFGVFWEGKLHGVIQFGPSINKKGTINLVPGTAWNGFIEINRMAFDDVLPRNSESRAISVALRILKRNCPFIDWVITFADATQCGTGTIYRACGFLLIAITKNTALRKDPVTGKQMHIIQAHHVMNLDFKNWTPIAGYQIKYIYFLNKDKAKNLAVKPLPYSDLDKYNYPDKVRR